MEYRECKICGRKFMPKQHNQVMCDSLECKRINSKKTRKSWGLEETKRNHEIDEIMTRRRPLKQIIDLSEKEKLRREAGISFGEMQVLVLNCKNKAEVIEKIEEIKRKNFLEASQKNADGTKVYTSGGGNGRAKHNEVERVLAMQKIL